MLKYKNILNNAILTNTVQKRFRFFGQMVYMKGSIKIFFFFGLVLGRKPTYPI